MGTLAFLQVQFTRYFFGNQVGICPVEEAVDQPITIWASQSGFHLLIAII